MLNLTRILTEIGLEFLRKPKNWTKMAAETVKKAKKELFISYEYIQ